MNRILAGLVAALAWLPVLAWADTPQPPSVVFGALFQQVASGDLFADSKQFADAVPRETPALILESYRRERPRSDDAWHRFLADHFDLGSQHADIAPTPGLPLAEHIAELWPLLTRDARTAPRYGSLLALPRPYVVPGGRFREVYYWDSYFTMLGFGPAQAPLRRDMVANFAYELRTYGHIPNGNRTYYLSRSQPPFFFLMVASLAPGHPAMAYARYLPELKTEYAFWMQGAASVKPGEAAGNVVGMPDGSVLNRYWDARDVPRDEAYRHDVTAAPPGDKGRFYRDIRAAAESGWDFSSRWFADGTSIQSLQTTAIVPVDLNSILYGLEQAIEQGCSAVRDTGCATSFAAKAAQRQASMRKYLWNGAAGLFDDYQWRTGHLLGNVTAATLYPLFFHVATQVEADRIARVVRDRLLKPGGLVTTDRTTGEQWDAPNGWAPLQWIAVMGLRAYGRTDLARTIAERWLTTVSTVYAQTGKLLEKYNVVTRTAGGGGEYPLQDGFGWTNGVTIGLRHLYPQ